MLIAPKGYELPMASLDDLLAQNFRAIRRAMGLTQEDMADAMGVTQPTVSSMEGRQGWRRFRRVDEQLRRAGADPLDLLDGSTPADAITAEIRRLLPLVDSDAREVVLAMLRQLARTDVPEQTQGDTSSIAS